MVKKILLLTLISAIIFFGYGTISYAQNPELKTPKPPSQDIRDKGSPNIEKAEPKSKPEPFKPLQTDIKSLMQFVAADRKTLIAEMKKSLKHYDNSRIFENKFPEIYGKLGGYSTNILVGYYHLFTDHCLNQAYSIQDQQAAGCVGSDTVSQCVDKLYFWCMNQHQPFKYWNELLLEMNNMIHLLNETIKNLQEIRNKLNNKQY